MQVVLYNGCIMVVVLVIVVVSVWKAACLELRVMLERTVEVTAVMWLLSCDLC